jgi:hypothetical protein
MKLLTQYKSYSSLKQNSYHNKYRLFSFIICILFLLSYYLYYLALEKCYKGQYGCGKKLGWIRKKIFQVIFSAIIIAILLELMILKLITKLHLIHVFAFPYIFYIYSHGDEFYDHGFYNLIGYSLILIIIQIFDIFNTSFLFLYIFFSF